MAAITDLSTATDAAGGDYHVISASGTDKKISHTNVMKTAALLASANTFTEKQTIQHNSGYTLKLEAGSSTQPGIELWDGAVTTNKWLISSGRASGTDGIFVIYDIRQNAPRLSINTTGSVRIDGLAGSGNRAVYSDSNGDLTNSSSDARMKSNIMPIGNKDALVIIDSLHPVRYQWHEDLRERLGNQVEIGLIAQDVAPLVPEVVGTNGDGMLTLDYAKLVPVLIGAIQTLSARVAALEAAQA